MALEHVAQGQTRFFTPGVAPDPRGILLGRFCLMTFPTLEGAVQLAPAVLVGSLARRADGEPDDHEGKTALGSREIVIQIPAVSSYAADRAARLCRLVGGAIYTGTAKHFVKYRDDRSPYGYDAVDIGAMPAQTDFMVHGDEFAQGYVKEGELPFARLLFRLSIRKLPGGEHLDAGGSRRAVPRGRARARRRHHPLSVAQPRRGAGRAVHAALAERVRRSRARARLHADPRAQRCPSGSSRCSSARPASTCSGPAGANAAVAVGYEHPIDLAIVRSRCSRPDTFHVFWPERSRRRAAGAARAQRHRGSDAGRSRARSPARSGAARGASAPSRSASSSARGRDGPAAPRRRDADPASSTRRGSSGSCSRCRRCRCAAIASRSPIAASS